MRGLTSKQAEKLLEQYGENVMESKKGNGPIKIFADSSRT